MGDWLIQIFRSSYDTLYMATFIVATFLFISGLDDIFVDMYYWFHHIFMKKKFNKFRYEPPEKIYQIPEKPIAIFTPASSACGITLRISSCERA